MSKFDRFIPEKMKMNTEASLMPFARVVHVLLLLLLAVGCAREPRQLSLLDAAATPAPPIADEDEAERQRLEQMQLVRLKSVTTGDEIAITADEFRSRIGPPLGGDLGDGDCGREIVCPTTTSLNRCSYDACVAMVDFCVARLLQSTALIRAEPIRFASTSSLHDYEAPGQSAATNAAILREAFDVVQQRLASISNFSFCNASTSAYPQEPIPGAKTTSYGPAAGTLYANAIADGFRLSQELALDATNAIVAVADAQRSVSPDSRKGAARSGVGSELSRAEAAHLLIGGDPGLLGNTTTAMCSSPELSGRGRKALALIRQAAPSPVTIKGTAPMETFLNGTVAAFPEGSIAARLAYLSGRCTGSPATCTITPVQQQTGISTEDFTQARSYLTQEMDAFARSTATTFIPSRVGGAASLPGVQFYAATRNEPAPPPPEYYAALARYVRPGWTPPANGALQAGLAQNLSAAYGAVQANAPSLINYAKTQITFPGQSLSFPDQWKLIDGTISGLLADDPRRGVLRHIRSGTSSTIVAHGYEIPDRIRVVRGMDGLLCATRGTIEGTPCADLAPHTVTTLNGGCGGLTQGYTKCVSNLVSNLTDSNTPLFLVRPRNPAEEVPGGYDYLIGFVANTPAVFLWTIMPDLDRRAGESLRPNQRWCTRSAVECDGTKFDERLPLENELSDDGDGVESSWKHYLSLADQAASEAHALGAEYIQNGLEVDRQTEIEQLRELGDQQRFATQAEGELETVQDICGTAMSTDELLGIVGVNLTGFSANRSNCVTSNDCCAPGPAPCAHTTCVSSVCQPKGCAKDSECCTGSSCEFKCLANQCARTVEGIISTPTSVEGLSRLQECVGDGTVAPFAIIGTEPVCMWTAANNSNLVCDKASEQYPCPAPPQYNFNAWSCSAVAVPSGSSPAFLVDTFNYAGKPFDVKLGLVSSGKSSLTSDPCVDLRRLRHGVGSRAEMCGRIWGDDIGSNYFVGLYDDDDAAVVSSMSARYTFNDAKGSRVDFSQEDRVRWSTAGIDGQTTAWPCADHAFATAADCAATPNSLFCQKVNCNSGATAAELKQLAAVNQRLTEATVLLKGLSRTDYDKITVPAVLGASELEPYAPYQAAGSTDFGPYLGVQVNAKNPVWFGITSLNFDGYVADGSPGTLPIFFRHYPAGSSTPTNYSITSTPYRALVPLPWYPGARPVLNLLRSSAMVCGDITSASYEAVPGTWRVTVDRFPPNFSWLPRGNGAAASVQDLDARLVPDLPYLTTRFRYDDQGIADAAELLCEAERGTLNPIQSGVACPALDPSTLQVADDFQQVKGYADCKVRDFVRSIGNLTLPRIPFRVLQGLHDSSQGGFPAVGGEMGAQMHRLRAALIRFGEVNTSMRDAAMELRDTVDDMNLSVQAVQVRSQQETLDVQSANLRGTQARIRLNQIDFQAQALWTKAALDCAGGIMSGIAGAFTSFGTSLLGSGVDCASAVVAADTESQNLNFERQIGEIEQTIAQNTEEREVLDSEYLALDHARDLIRQRGLVRTIAGRMAQLQTDARASVEEITAALAELEGLRLKVLRSISRATQYDSTAAAATRNIDSVLNAKLDVSKRRYQRAHENAIRLAFLAKRAIEQRLGVHLSELRADLPLVDAPSNWESKICTAQGIDYAAISNPDANSRKKNFQEAYIGDYVNNLRNVVESYRLEFDFQEGTDEVVASVRDDVFGTRQLCEKSLGNMLTYSGRLNYLTADPALPGWQVEGCPAGANGVASECLNIGLYSPTPLPQGAVTGGARGYAMTWGSTGTLQERLVQRVKLSPGRYRVSWFTVEVAGQGPEIDAGLFDATTNTAVPSVSGGSPAASRWFSAASSGYSREYRIFDVKNKGNYLVKLIPAAIGSDRTGAIAGIMLDPLTALDSLEDPARLRPPPFVATEADTARMIKACEDSDGSAFRGHAWTRRCERLCRDGFSGSCEQSDRVSSCFWEATISIDQRDLEEGVIFKHAGFAAGNFNYRIEDIAVNFVGSEVRDCETSENPSACYAGGFVPYSIKHVGPFFVRNHEGADFNVKLFTGNIEHARGLGLERYLTNPLSSTDRELLTPYIRTEFQGRPLDGSLLLRVWEEPGVDFNAIEDVQLYIKYRYWTRSQ